MLASQAYMQVLFPQKAHPSEMSIFFSVETLDVEDIVLTPADEAMLDQIEDDHLPPTQIESNDEMEEHQLEWLFTPDSPQYSHICDFENPAEKLSMILRDIDKVEDENGGFETYDAWWEYIATHYIFCCEEDRARIYSLLPHFEGQDFESIKAKQNVWINIKKDHVYETIE